MKKLLLIIPILISMASCNNQQDKAQIVLDCIMTRTSVRSYTSEKVDAETVEKLMKAAMAAPCSKNRQLWEFVVVDDRKVLDTLAAGLRYATMLTEAPLAIVVCEDTFYEENGEKVFNQCWQQNTSAATENILLAAHAMGLGAVWTAAYDEERQTVVREALGITGSIMPLCVIALGWPDVQKAPKDKWKPEKVHYNRY